MKNSSPETAGTFCSLNLPADLLAPIQAQDFTTPTPIQQQTIPLALEGHDILGTAQTGTGKTLAFALPMVAHLLKNRDTQLIVLVPTRELAQQVLKTFQFLTNKLRFLRSVLLIGGAPSYQQKKDLRREPRIIVGTPGRVIDHFNQGNLKADQFRYVVLDEMDRMLDMGFEIQLKEIFEHLPAERQTLMYSATLPEDIKKQAARYLTDPKQISIGRQSQPAAKIEQQALFVAGQQKMSKLIEILENNQDDEQATIVFVKTKTDASDLAFELREKNFNASAMHGDLSQSQRQRVLQQFRMKKLNILVATDIASRGIDVSHVGLVVNYALPQATEDYVHRIGRTARGGRSGRAISLISFGDKRKWYEILQLTDPEQAESFFAEHLRGAAAPRRGRQSQGGGGRPQWGNQPRQGNNRFNSGKKMFGEGPEGSSGSRFSRDDNSRRFPRDDRSSTSDGRLSRDDNGRRFPREERSGARGGHFDKKPSGSSWGERNQSRRPAQPKTEPRRWGVSSGKVSQSS